jgi:hypothetical protein
MVALLAPGSVTRSGAIFTEAKKPPLLQRSTTEYAPERA